ncbi:MAG TPA: hypothetical protein DE315_06415 [Candidatus Omnitrophica bacterium]|nr:hypothetical protein [Candidatus Omnitrophota bacterium]HCI45143.1 hypothetical protein [Candidatus Omnitrophota bacterium]
MLFFAVIFLLAGTVQAETIRLKSGLVVEGTVAARTPDAIKVDSGIGILITYYLDEIEEIIAAPAPPPGSDQTPAPPVPTDLPTAAPVQATQNVSFVPPQPPPGTPPPKQPAPSAAQETRRELQLYTQSTLPPGQAPSLGRDEYLETQFEKAMAVERELARQAVQSLKEYLTSRWRGLKDAYPLIKTTAEGPSSVPVAAGLWAGVYVLLCFPLMRIAHRLKAGGWTAWVPILQIFLILRIANKSSVWFLFFFFPGINLIAFLFAWMSIARRLERPHWLGYLMLVPGVNVLILWYLALLRDTSAVPKKQDDIDTGIKFE